MAQWLERRSLAGGLSLIYGRHVTTSWVKCRFGSTIPGQLSLPSLWRSKWVITWITVVDTIKRQTRAAYGCSS